MGLTTTHGHMTQHFHGSPAVPGTLMVLRQDRFVGSDASEWSNNQTRIARAAVLDERASRHALRLRASEEGSGPQRAIRAGDVRAADLQEEPTKPIVDRADSLMQAFRRIRRRRRLPGEHRSERSEPLDTASASGTAALEARGLDVLSPLCSQCVADLAERRLGASGGEHRFHHVAIGPGDLDHLLQC
jgi:hypothetical protein